MNTFESGKEFSDFFNRKSVSSFTRILSDWINAFAILTSQHLKISILTKDHFITGSWSGGSTTQLYIHPPDATYIDRNFELRISTATVEISESSFTALPSIDRKLMVLEGEIVISHKGRYTKRLMPYEVDTFSGDWETKSVGTCTDFNVMTTGQIDSELYHISIDSDDAYNLNLKKACIKLFLYSPATNHGLQIDRAPRLKNSNEIAPVPANRSRISMS